VFRSQTSHALHHLLRKPPFWEPSDEGLLLLFWKFVVITNSDVYVVVDIVLALVNTQKMRL